MTNNNQRDPRWANTPVGFGEQTIGQVGCTLSVIGDILGLSPDAVNEAMKRVQGFSDGVNVGKGNLVIWSKIEEAFPGVKIKRVWSYDNDDVLKNIPNVIVEVPAAPIGGRGSHWVRYIGNHQLEDPWTGTIRPTSDFPNPTGYCVINPAVITQPIAQPTTTGFHDNTVIPVNVITAKESYGEIELQVIRSKFISKDQDLQAKDNRIQELDKQVEDTKNLLADTLDRPKLTIEQALDLATKTQLFNAFVKKFSP